MSFSDPQSLTINAVPNTLPRISSGPNSGAFSNADGTVRMSVSHAYGKRIRRTMRVDASKIGTDPVYPGQNVRSSMSVYIVVDTPVVGYTVTEAKQVVDALVAKLSASTGASVAQLLGGEN